MSTASDKGFLRSAFTDNLGLKFVALAASIGLFFIVRGTEDAQMSVSVDVVALLPPPTTERMLVSEIPDQVRVNLRGSRSVLNAVRRERIPPIQMDLRDASQHFYYFDPDEIELPGGTSIVQIAPAAVPLTWVDRGERRVQIDPILEGELADGLILGERSSNPPSVLVRGPRAEVARLDRVPTEAVDVRGLDAGTHQRRVPLVPLPDHVTYVELVSVVVTVQIQEEAGTRTYEDVEVAVVGGADVTLRPNHVAVEVAGPRTRLEELSARRVVPFVDVSTIDPLRGAQPLPIQIRPLSAGLTATTDPPEILVVPARP